jgi:hypothetical protein
MDFDEKRRLYPQYGRTTPFYKRGKGLEINTMELDGDLEITSAFECGTGENFIRQGKDHFSVELEADPIPVSEAVPVGLLCVQVTNYGTEPRQARLDVLVHPTLREMNWTHICKSDYFIQRGGTWAQMPVEKTVPGENIFRLLIDVGPGERVIVSNNIPYSYSQLVAETQALAAAHPDRVLLRSYGTSVQGRDLPVLTFGEREGARRLAFACTPQPGEPASWAVMGIADFLASDDPEAQEIVEQFAVDLLPMTNPDGVVAGWRKINAQGVQPLFEFDKIVSTGSDCPEAVLEWNWLTTHVPEAFAEMHLGFRRIADRPSQPYVVDRALYSTEERRALARQMDLAVIGLDPDGAFRNIEVDDPVWKTMLCYQLPAQCDSLAYLYQIIGLGIEGTQRRSIELLRAMVRVLGR